MSNAYSGPCEPLRIDIKLSTPMLVPGDLFHLDALLGALKVKEVERRLRTAFNPRDYHHDIPVDHYTSKGGDWVFKASAFMAEPELSGFTWMQSSRINLSVAAQHRDSGLLKYRAAKPNPAGGPFKTSIQYQEMMWARMKAFCIGDKAAITELLGFCRQIGGRRGVGAGQVSSIAVTSVAADECLWHLRAMPSDWEGANTDQWASSVGALRAPYWDRTEHGLISVPISLPG